MKAFPWRAGMLSIDGHRVLAVGADGLPSVWAVERYGAPRIIHYQPFMGDVWTRARPDPKDGPTKGGFLEAIRVAFGDPTIHTSYSFTWKKWYMYRNGGVMGSNLEDAEDRFSLGAFDDEWSALEAAWRTAP